MTSIDWPRFVEIIRGHQRFVLTSHIRPDCDALGSELGMAGVLEALEKDVVIVNPHPTPPNLAFIDPEARIRVLNEHLSAADLEDREILIVLDTSAWAQLGDMGTVVRETGARRIILDHHVSEDDLGAEAFKDTSAEATGRLVVEAAQQLGVPLTPAIAAPLFAAVATDTGWFRFSSVGSVTYRTAAQLIDAGVVPAEIYEALYEQDSAARVRLRGVILSRIQCEQNGRLAHTWVRVDDFAQTGAERSDTEDAINLALGIKGVEVAIILVGQSENEYKISFRSRCDVDCSQLAEQFQGGGHKAAAGATIHAPFEEAQRRVLDAVLAAMR